MSKNFQCKICQKKYASKQSLSNHKRIKHKDEKKIPKNDQPKNELHKNIDIVSISTNINIGPYECKYCNKKYKFRQGKYRHQAKCDSQHAIAVRLLDEKKKLYNENKKIFYEKMQQYDKMSKNNTIKDPTHNIKMKIIEEYYDELNKLDNIYDKQNEIYALARLYNVYEIDKLNNIYKSFEKPNINTADNVNNLLTKKENTNNDITPTKKYIKNKIQK